MRNAEQICAKQIKDIRMEWKKENPEPLAAFQLYERIRQQLREMAFSKICVFGLHEMQNHANLQHMQMLQKNAIGRNYLRMRL